MRAAAAPFWRNREGSRRVGLLVHDIVNRGLAITLLALSLPLFVPIGLAVLITSGRPVFYRGDRLGRHKRVFKMYKFRSLVTGAEQKIGGRMLSRDDDLVTPIGWFIRDTRLDELPQLLNIIKGDMSFVGPRPERPEVYRALCAGIDAYDSRFEVRPGLVGWSQLFTPHSTPKRIRALIDARMMSRHPRPVLDLFLVAYTAVVVALSSALRLVRTVGKVILGGWRHHTNRRRLSRVPVHRAGVIAHGDDGRSSVRAPVTDINESSFVMDCGEPLDGLRPSRFDLILRVDGNGGRPRRFRASCRGRVVQVRNKSDGYAYVVNYEPVTERSLYVVHQHFLRRSLART